MITKRSRNRYHRNDISIRVLAKILAICLLVTTLAYISIHQSNKNTRTKRFDVDNLRLLENQAESMLDSNQKERLGKILSGELSKTDIEIVLARYNEDIRWSSMYSNIITVYDKADRYNISLYGNNVIRLPNLGRECFTYLHHIVNNYDKLAKVTVFAQASAPTRGYKGHRHGGGHLLGNSSFHDFVLNPNGHFIFTAALWFPTAAHEVRVGYNSEHIPRSSGMSKCWDMSDKTSSVEKNGRFSFSLIKILEHIVTRCQLEKSNTCSIPLFWDKFIRLQRPYKDIVFFAQVSKRLLRIATRLLPHLRYLVCLQGAIFSATAEQIRRRPLSDYRDLLQQCRMSEDPSAGFFMEWFWYYLVTSDIAPCPDVTGSEFEWAARLPYYEHFDFPTRIKYANFTSSVYIFGTDPKPQRKGKGKSFLRWKHSQD